VVPQALDLTAGSPARRCRDRVWQRLGYDPEDTATWDPPRVHLPCKDHFAIEEVAPTAAAAMGQLLGGWQRCKPVTWCDAIIANLGVGADRPPVPPGPELGGWHKDGDFFVHFLDSPEQALLTIILWSDVVPGGGATAIAADSVPRVARELAAHPEGLWPQKESPEYRAARAAGERCTLHDWKPVVAECRDFREATGRAGDIYLMHPFMLHATGQNRLRRPRFITNPPVHYREPMAFANPARSVVEQVVVDACGDAAVDFTIRAPRRGVTPPRLLQHGLGAPRLPLVQERQDLGLQQGQTASDGHRGIAQRVAQLVGVFVLADHAETGDVALERAQVA